MKPDTQSLLDIIRSHVGGCREWSDDPPFDRCGQPADFVLWGKLVSPEGLGPRCYGHAVKYVGDDGLRKGTTHALIHLGDLADAIVDGVNPLVFASNVDANRQ